MEGIPAPDVADYKRRKEIELGLNPGTITQPQAKRPKFENRVLTEGELKIQLEAHKALMGASESTAISQPSENSGAVFNAAPQTYVAPAAPAVIPPTVVGAPPFLPGAPVPPIPGAAPFTPFPGMAGLPPGWVDVSPVAVNITALTCPAFICLPLVHLRRASLLQASLLE